MIKVDDQTDEVTCIELWELIKVAQENNRPINIDWVNRTIRVTSEKKPLIRNGKHVQLSDGTAYYRDVLVKVSSHS